MRYLLYIYLLFPFSLAALSPDTAIYETGAPFKARCRIDELVLKNLKEHNLSPAGEASDAVFLRRVYLDLIGTVPTFKEAKSFLADKSENKRSELIDTLLNRKEFAMYWSLKWCDILRVKSEFPINLWPNAVQAYHHWVEDSISKNRPYDQFARDLLTSSGSNFRKPAVNFYRATQDRTPGGFAKVAVQTFLCSRFEKWPDNQKKELEKLFSRIAIKGTDEWKEQIVYLNPEPAEPMRVTMPDGRVLNVAPDQDPRRVFADWLINSPNYWFEEAAVNRVWFWLFGRGLVQEPDDFVFKNRDQGFIESLFKTPSMENNGNPPSNPELLRYLAETFRKSGYDFKALCRLITNSATYQQSFIPARKNAKDAEKYFAVYPVHRIDAEVLRDIFTYLADYKPKYMSVIPEPFTFIPRDQPTIALGDGSITSSFLEKFGKPARDTGYLSERNNTVTYTQRLFLLNSPVIQGQIVRTAKFRNIVREAHGNLRAVVNNIYLFILSRRASDAEFKKIMKLTGMKSQKDLIKEIRTKNGKKKNLTSHQQKMLRLNKKRNRSKLKNAAKDFVWTLVNTKEFLFKH